MKKKNNVKAELITNEEAEIIQKKLNESLEKDLEFSLNVDPENKYGMSDEQKKFIEYYVNFKSIMAAADFAGISPDQAKNYFVAYSTQQEIRRINRALYQRQFANKLITLDEIGGYLSSLLKDEVPIADQIKSNEKIRVAQMIIDLNTLKLEALNNNPSSLMNKDLEVELQNLSVKTIKNLLETNDKKNQKEKKNIVDKISNDLTIEEKSYLESLPAKDLLEILERKEKDE